ncbi:TetR/AcrR family transcriptional regulator [Rhizobium sp. P32RR-XVIII]|uniref:TetR/AcrR family transcriptional regulator n=1 Tax=Rhizobium sp. P32RR-XVIII TaxID=2726738 RepID=UPI0014573A31|nr:TetR/AcrR family transcriptional regulator [Rhizobium sp. P32RR-XVIII]NLS06215.1 TetR/AcrR family transcriptional regulator [Rhizobium sp. P32RR-XVIII]
MLAAAIAERYWQDTKAWLEEVAQSKKDPLGSLRTYHDTFWMSSDNGNRLCLGSFLGGEYDDLPEAVRKEVHLRRRQCGVAQGALINTVDIAKEDCEQRTRAIFVAVAGAQLLARSRSDISFFDSMIKNYRVSG